VFSRSSCRGNGIGKEDQRKVETPTEKAISRTRNQQKKQSRQQGQVLGEGERELRGKLRGRKRKSTEKESTEKEINEKTIKTAWRGETVAAARAAPQSKGAWHRQ